MENRKTLLDYGLLPNLAPDWVEVINSYREDATTEDGNELFRSIDYYIIGNPQPLDEWVNTRLEGEDERETNFLNRHKHSFINTALPMLLHKIDSLSDKRISKHLNGKQGGRGKKKGKQEVEVSGTNVSEPSVSNRPNRTKRFDVSDLERIANNPFIVTTDVLNKAIEFATNEKFSRKGNTDIEQWGRVVNRLEQAKNNVELHRKDVDTMRKPLSNGNFYLKQYVDWSISKLLNIRQDEDFTGNKQRMIYTISTIFADIAEYSNSNPVNAEYKPLLNTCKSQLASVCGNVDRNIIANLLKPFERIVYLTDNKQVQQPVRTLKQEDVMASVTPVEANTGQGDRLTFSEVYDSSAKEPVQGVRYELNVSITSAEIEQEFNNFVGRYTGSQGKRVRHQVIDKWAKQKFYNRTDIVKGVAMDRFLKQELANEKESSRNKKSFDLVRTFVPRFKGIDYTITT